MHAASHACGHHMHACSRPQQVLGRHYAASANPRRCGAVRVHGCMHVRSGGGAHREQMKTRAPSEASLSAVARPIPAVPPVTSATLPSRRRQVPIAAATGNHAREWANGAPTPIRATSSFICRAEFHSVYGPASQFMGQPARTQAAWHTGSGCTSVEAE